MAGNCHGAESDNARCIFSLEVLSDGTNGMHIPGDTSIGEGVFLYQYIDGYIVGEVRRNKHGSQTAFSERIGGGPEFRDRMIALFKSTGLHHMDFASDLDGAKSRAELAGDHWGHVGFGKTKLTAHFEGTDVDIESECLVETLDHYARFEPEFQRLKNLVEQVELEYAKNHLRPINY
jgi:hypothetical protein